MLPVVVGSLLAAAISGRVIATARRYKPYPVAGAALVAGGLLLLSSLDRHSPAALAALYMLIVGVGIGLVMQVVILVAQNHAPRRHIGVATSTATFARSIGASIGVAIFGAIFASHLSSELASLGPAAKHLAAAGVRLDPAQVRALPSAIEPGVVDAFARALQATFTVGAAFAAAAVAAVLLLPRALQPGEGPTAEGSDSAAAAQSPAGVHA
jgi:MFS family permease